MNSAVWPRETFRSGSKRPSAFPLVMPCTLAQRTASS